MAGYKPTATAFQHRPRGSAKQRRKARRALLAFRGIRIHRGNVAAEVFVNDDKTAAIVVLKDGDGQN
jgi:hypothetical protein